MKMEQLISKQLVFNASEIRSIDLRVEAQVHTNWTDGKNSVSEMEKAARDLGLRALVYSEHTSSGSGSWYSKFVAEVRELPNSEIEIFTGTEVRISDHSGAIDLDAEVAELAEIVLASVHRFPDNNGKPIEFSNTSDSPDVCDTELSLMVAAIRNKRAHIIAHPFGMSLCRFNQNPSVLHWAELIEVATEFEVALEFNSKYHKDDFTILERYMASDCLMSIGSDAHSVEAIGVCSREITQFLGLV
jgi:DNA polymerase (family 10)